MAYPPKHAGDRPGSLASDQQPEESKNDRDPKDPTRVISDPYSEDSFVTCDEIDLSNRVSTPPFGQRGDPRLRRCLQRFRCPCR